MRMKRTPLLLCSFPPRADRSACKRGDNRPRSKPRGSAVGIDLAAMDKSVKPGDDFFATPTAIGSSAPRSRPTAARSAASTSPTRSARRTASPVRPILKSNAAAGTDEGRIANYYKAYLDTGAIDRAGLAPAKADLDAIAAIADKRQLSAAIGKTIRADVDPLNATNFGTENLFGIFVTQGLNTPGETLPYILQGGLGMPDRDYYLSADPKMADILRASIAPMSRR
jgi:putative endopeptidase